MNLYKRIISLFLVFAICISSMVTVAFAADDRAVASGFTPADFSSAVSYGAAIDENFGFLRNAVGYLGTLREAMATGSCDGCTVNPDGRHNFLPSEVLTTSWAAALKGGEACICRYCGITYNDFYVETYNAYLSDLQTDLGTTTLIDGGVRIYVNFNKDLWSGTSSYYEKISSSYGVYNTVVYRYKSSGSISFSPYMNGSSGTVTMPFTGRYRFGMELSTNATYTSWDWAWKGDGFASASQGTVIKPDSVTFNSVRGSDYINFSLAQYIDCYPLTDSDLPTSLDVTINSRPSTIVGDYGIIGDDGTIIKVDGNMIVDESTSTVFNPVTNVTNNYTDYAFDYSDRSYNLTLEDGSTLKVVYGDENVTIQEGDTIYNVYYIIESGGSGDDSGSGGGSDSGDTPSGEDMSWWKQAWTNFTDKLFSILGNGGSSVNPDNAPAVPDDEETGEKGYSVIDLFVVLKDGTWAFITGIVSTAYDGFTGFVESVSSAGSFFTFYDEESEDGILFVPLEGGETIWD